MAKFEIKHSDKAGTTPAWAVLVEAFNDLVQEGFAAERGAWPIQSTDHVIYLVNESDGDVIGALAWRPCTTVGAALIVLAYVEPSSRKQGGFKMMWEQLKEDARLAGLDQVILSVAVANKVGLEVMRKLAARAQFVEFVQPI